MLLPPDRVGEIVGKLERGEPVDVKKFSTLIALDAVAFSRQQVEEAILHNEAEDARFIEAFGGGTTT